MKKPTDLGTNRTGVGTSPIQSKKLVEGSAEGVPGAAVTSAAINVLRSELAREAEPLGTIPPPLTVKGMAKSMVQALKGEKATVLVDCLAERLAFERTGTRLYEALLSKLAGADPAPTRPTRAELERIRDDELAHFQLLTAAIEELGADPTVMTPGADVVAVASAGWVQVLTDPRTTLNQGLNTILMAELVDNDSWDRLVELASRLGMEDLATRLQQAADQEDEHLVMVRQWAADGVQGDAGLEPLTTTEARVP
jgi:rubrerythrin